MQNRNRSRLPFRITLIASSLLLCTGATLSAQTPANPPIQVIRVSHGNVEGLKLFIRVSNEACRAAKHLPPQEVALPSDDYLAKFSMMEIEELFDGQRHAKFTTQRQISSDASSGCKLMIFTYRAAISDLVCVSRISGGTPLLNELSDFDHPSSAPPAISEEALGASSCSQRPRPKDTAGVALVDAGGTSCFWNGELMASHLAKLTGKPTATHTGLDVCLYASLPEYYYQGAKEQVILMSRVFGKPEGGTVIEQTTGATGEMALKSFSATQPIPKSRFERSAVEAFLHQPTKSSL